MIKPNHPFKNMLGSIKKPLCCPHCGEPLSDMEVYVFSKREIFFIQMVSCFGLAAIIWAVFTM